MFKYERNLTEKNHTSIKGRDEGTLLLKICLLHCIHFILVHKDITIKKGMI